MMQYPKRSFVLNSIIFIYFILSLVIGFSAVLFGLKNAMNVDIIENIVVISILFMFLIMVVFWKRIGVYGVIASHIIFIMSCIFQCRRSILTESGLVYLAAYIITLIIPILFFIHCKKSWSNFQ